MAIEDQVFEDLTPGMFLTIEGAAERYNVSYSGAQRALRKLWRAGFLKRSQDLNNKRRVIYEGCQERLL